MTGSELTPVPSPFRDLKLRSLLLWIPLGFAAIIGAGSGLEAIGVPSGDPVYHVSIALVAYAMAGCWVAWAMNRWHVRLRRLLGVRPEFSTWRPMLVVIVAHLLVTLTMVQVYAHLAPSYFEKIVNEEGALVSSKSAFPDLHVLLTVVMVVFAAPLVEEIFFRGILMHRLAARWNLPVAVVLSSTAFGLLHVEAVSKFFFAVVLAGLYIRTRSLVIPVLCHMVNNSIGALYLLGPGREANAEGAAGPGSLPIQSFLVLVVLSSFLAVYLFRAYWPRWSWIPPYDAVGDEAG